MTTSKTDMRETVLSAAKLMVQAHGYNALSFRDLAEQVGIKSASVHYHFPTKGDLAAELARRYTDDGSAYLAELSGKAMSPAWMMERYTEIFRSALANDNRMCLCGIMSAELDALPPTVRKEVNGFAEMNIAWLEGVLVLAHPQKPAAALKDQAMAIFTAIEGAQLVARGCEDITIYDKSIAAYRSSGLMP